MLAVMEWVGDLLGIFSVSAAFGVGLRGNLILWGVFTGGEVSWRGLCRDQRLSLIVIIVICQ